MSDTDATATSGRYRFARDTESGHAIVSLTTMATIIVVCGILYVAKDLFLPLALGMLFAFILNPVVNALRKRGLRDVPAVVITVLTAAAMVAAFVRSWPTSSASSGRTCRSIRATC
jgi:predicted PurR-regulated permease PerM